MSSGFSFTGNRTERFSFGGPPPREPKRQPSPSPPDAEVLESEWASMIGLSPAQPSISFMLNETSGRSAPVYTQDAPHPGIFCNHCQRMLQQGPRYACLDCTDFDLCATCEEDAFVRISHFEGKHLFAKVRSTAALGGNDAIAKHRPQADTSDMLL